MKITLVMATKNAAQVTAYIGQALSISPIFDEVIVHSNSYDATKWIPQYRNMTILFKDEPISCPDALNITVAQAKGDWILPLCDDDFCNIPALDELLIQVRQGLFADKDIIFSPFYTGNETDGYTLWPRVEVSFDKLKESNLLPFTSLYKRAVWEDIGGYKNLPFNDWLFWLESAKKQKQFVLWDKPYFYFRHGHLQEPSLCDRETVKQPFEETRKQLLNYLENKSC